MRCRRSSTAASVSSGRPHQTLDLYRAQVDDRGGVGRRGHGAKAPHGELRLAAGGVREYDSL